MKWEKLGQIFCPNQNFPWMYSYASYPWTEILESGLIKCYFSCRDRFNRSSVGYVILDINNPQKIIDISTEPILTKGETGTFDDSGVSFSCILNTHKKKYLYYLGWNILKTVPWKNTIGLAIEDSDGNFQRYSKAPVLGIHDIDPFTLTYPFVMYDEGTYKMWYGTSLFWGPKVEDTVHIIRYATSSDGIHWRRYNIECIKPENPKEFAIVKPFVIKEHDLYKMWYSYRIGEKYKMGYAESFTGMKWERKDDLVGIAPSKEGWDSDMVCYPSILDFKDNRYMFYNGNGYGKTGFGLAVLQ